MPADSERKLAKSVGSDADVLILDLEDSVVPARKAEARTALAAWLRSGATAGSHKTIIVRVNAPDTPHFAEDIAAGLGWRATRGLPDMVGSAWSAWQAFPPGT